MLLAFISGIVTGYFLFYAFAPRPDFRSNIHVEASKTTVVDPNHYLQAAIAQCEDTLRSAMTSVEECTTKLMREIDEKEDCDARSHAIQDDADHWQKKYEGDSCYKSSDEGKYFLY